MKKLISCAVFALLAGTVSAQVATKKTATKPQQTTAATKYDAKFLSGMKGAITKLEACSKAEEYEAVSNTFARIAEAEPKSWLPKYYQAYSTIMNAMSVEDKGSVDGLLDRADLLLESALKETKASDEILCLMSLSKSARIGVDPTNRGMRYSQESERLLLRAEKVNPNNPRIHLLRGQSAYYTPEEFGGGKGAAIEHLTTALDLFQKEKVVDELYPSWGMGVAKDMFKKCSE